MNVLGDVEGAAMNHRLDSEKLSVPAAARRLGVSRSKAYDLVASGELPALRIGRRVVVCAEDLDAFIDSHRVTVGGATR